MIKVVILGSGNLGYHLTTVLSQQDRVQFTQVFAINTQNLPPLPKSIAITNNLNSLLPADVYILAISDNALAEVSSRLPFSNRLVVHTAGGLPINELNNKNRSGVFYPLQTFSKQRDINFTDIPICIEAQNNDDYTILETVAKSISTNVVKTNSEQRKALHLSAVFVNNFTNHLYLIGQDICQAHNVSFSLLKPLISETANKILELSPTKAQTGPASRGDFKTIQAHLDFLSDANYKQIYSLLTKSILQNV